MAPRPWPFCARWGSSYCTGRTSSRTRSSLARGLGLPSSSRSWEAASRLIDGAELNPPGPLFWAYATGAAHVAAGIAILTGVQARLAAGLLTVKFAAFGVLVHAPLAFADPASQLNWVMNAMNLALTGAAWVVADTLAERRATAPRPKAATVRQSRITGKPIDYPS